MKHVLNIICILSLCTIALSIKPNVQQDDKQNELASKPTLLIIDTAGHQEYYYRNLVLLARSVGFNIEFCNFYQVLENGSIPNYDAVFFMTSLELLKHLQHDLSKNFIKILESFSTARNKIIGFLAPAAPQYNEQLFRIMAKAVEVIGTFNDENGIVQTNTPLRTVMHSFLNYILQGDAHKGSMYGTTLINQAESLPVSPKILDAWGKEFSQEIDHATGEVIASLLPIDTNFSEIIKNTLPSGISIKHKSRNTIYFISKVSEFTFADVAENFFKNPFHMEQRNELLQVAQQMLWELYNAHQRKGLQKSLPESRPPLPEKLTTDFILQEKKRAESAIKSTLQKNSNYSWIIQQGISCGWLEPGDYFLGEDASIAKKEQHNPAHVASLKAQALEEGINFLFLAHINLLWFEFIPERYIAKHAIFKDQKRMFIDHIISLALALRKSFEQHNQPFPKVFVGMNITTNYKNNPVHEPIADVFGSTLSQIPSPLDYKHFWKPEVVEVFELFYASFSKVLPIDGVFLDFEMYHAQHQASTYSDLVDFSTTSWQLYCANTENKKCKSLKTVAERVAYLIQNKAFKEYFEILESEAANLGRKLKKKLRAIKPNLLVAAYEPTLPESWFYRGMFAGLSAPDEPLILATFNTDFYSHYQWLVQHDIYALHGEPFLLSKFPSEESFCQIPAFSNYHYFSWYLRPSRVMYKNKQGHSWSSEASPLDNKTLAQGLAHPEATCEQAKKEKIKKRKKKGRSSEKR